MAPEEAPWGVEVAETLAVEEAVAAAEAADTLAEGSLRRSSTTPRFWTVVIVNLVPCPKRIIARGSRSKSVLKLRAPQPDRSSP
jgi:hypothetical protein